MGKPSPNDDRSQLPDGWNWANWQKASDAQQFWEDADEKLRQKFRHRFKQITSNPTGLRHELGYYDESIGTAKLIKPNPGWRAWFFRDGDKHFITHFSKKNPSRKSKEHNKQIATAIGAKNEHHKKQKASQ